MSRPALYLDASAILRVFDTSGTARVRRERADVLRLLDAIRTGRCTAVWSRAHQLELVGNGPYQHAFIAELRRSWRAVQRSKVAPAKARAFAAAGLHGVDAAHLAYAVIARARVLVTTDDRFRKTAARIAGLRVEVLSPTATLVRLGLR